VTAEQPVIRGEMFFSGVESRQSLKKRYKDLERKLLVAERVSIQIY